MFDLPNCVQKEINKKKIGQTLLKRVFGSSLPNLYRRASTENLFHQNVHTMTNPFFSVSQSDIYSCSSNNSSNNEVPWINVYKESQINAKSFRNLFGSPISFAV
ncbi:hypothetical protein PGB90_004043 [Kerria lacca]